MRISEPVLGLDRIMVAAESQKGQVQTGSGGLRATSHLALESVKHCTTWPSVRFGVGREPAVGVSLIKLIDDQV